MSYNYKKLRFFLDDSDGWLRRNQAVAEKFCLAEDDHEVREAVSLLHPAVHTGSFWGVARGLPAAAAVFAQEQGCLRITWLSGVEALTSHSFTRHGYVQVLQGCFPADVPVIGPWLSAFFQKPVKESIVVREGKIVFRDVGYAWNVPIE